MARRVRACKDKLAPIPAHATNWISHNERLESHLQDLLLLIRRQSESLQREMAFIDYLRWKIEFLRVPVCYPRGKAEGPRLLVRTSRGTPLDGEVSDRCSHQPGVHSRQKTSRRVASCAGTASQVFEILHGWSSDILPAPVRAFRGVLRLRSR